MAKKKNKTYEVEIVETIVTNYKVQASSGEEAEQLALELHDNEEGPEGYQHREIDERHIFVEVD